MNVLSAGNVSWLWRHTWKFTRSVRKKQKRWKKSQLQHQVPLPLEQSQKGSPPKSRILIFKIWNQFYRRIFVLVLELRLFCGNWKTTSRMYQHKLLWIKRWVITLNTQAIWSFSNVLSSNVFYIRWNYLRNLRLVKSQTVLLVLGRSK